MTEKTNRAIIVVMPSRDIYHDTVKTALTKDGWRITHDPFPLSYGVRRLYADLGAEKLFTAEKASRKIVVEVKSFRSPSEVEDLREAIGSYSLYHHILADTHPDWELYLAIPYDAFESVFRQYRKTHFSARSNCHKIALKPRSARVTFAVLRF
jgi:hypothetical protein